MNNKASSDSEKGFFSHHSSCFLYGASCEERFAFARLLYGYGGKAEGAFVVARLSTVPRILQEEAFFGPHEQSWMNQAKGGMIVISEIDSLVPVVQQRFASMLACEAPSLRIVMTSAHDKALLLERHALGAGLHHWLTDLDNQYCVGAQRIKAAQCLSSGVLSGFSALIEPILRDHAKEWLEAEINGLYGHIIAEIERPLIMMALNHTRGNQIKAAALLGLNRNTLRKKIKELQISVSRNDKSGDRE